MKPCVKIRIPTTCGELIQGPYLSQEALISLPIDRYTEVSACYHEKKNEKTADTAHLQPKAAEGFLKAVRHLGLTAEETERIEISLSQSMPSGKGYASSTSDICGVMAAVFELFEAPQPPEVLAVLCAGIEPSDGLMFKNWTLFDHLSGRVLRQYPAVEGIRILILEPDSTCLTDTFRGEARIRKALSLKTDRPFQQFEKAVASGSWLDLFKASTSSALENQMVLMKPHLDEIVAVSEAAGAYGVVCAHSGTILGIALPEETSPESLLKAFETRGLLKVYGKQFMVRTVRGGYDLIEGE
jgi:L-threonine kinase